MGRQRATRCLPEQARDAEQRASKLSAAGAPAPLTRSEGPSLCRPHAGSRLR